MNDYSEVTCHLQKDVVNLINALNDKKWDKASTIAWKLSSDVEDVATFAVFQHNTLGSNNEPK